MSVLEGVGPQVNKFEQVTSDDHQMSVVGLGVGPMSGIWLVGPISGIKGGVTHVLMHHG